MTVATVTLILASLFDNAQEQCVAPLPSLPPSLPSTGGRPDPAEHNTAAAADSGDGEEKPVAWERGSNNTP